MENSEQETSEVEWLSDFGKKRVNDLYREKAECVDRHTSSIRYHLHTMFVMGSGVHTVAFFGCLAALVPGIFVGWDLGMIAVAGAMFFVLGHAFRIASEHVENPRRQDLDC